MAVNFTPTFKQPLTAAFDQGLVFSGTDIAKYITRYYVDTVKTGIGPIGTPPNPYLTADSRSNLMESILSLYYQTNDISNLQGNIKDLTTNINNLVNKGQKLQQSISSTVSDITQTTQLISRLPSEFIQLAQALITFIKNNVNSVDDLVNNQVVTLFDTIPFVDDEGFKTTFDKYKVKLETLKDLPTSLKTLMSDITPFNATEKIVYISSLPAFIGSLATDTRGDLSYVGLLISDVTKKLEIAFLELLNVIQAIIDPQKSLQLLESLITTNTDLKKVYDKLKTFVTKQALLGNKLKKLNTKRDELLERVEREVNQKIDKYKKVIDDKIKALQTKIESAITTQNKIKFITETTKSVKGEITILANKVKKIINEIVKNITRLQKILTIIQAVASLINDIKNEVESFLKEVKTQATKTSMLFEQLGSLYQSEYNRVLDQIQSQQQGIQNTTNILVGLTDQLESPSQYVNNIALSISDINSSLTKAKSLFTQKGLDRYVGVAIAPILSGVSSYVNLKQYLEFSSKNYNVIFQKAQTTVNEALDLYDEIKADVEKRPYVKVNRPLVKIRDLALTSEDLFKKLEFLFTKLNKVKKLITDRIEKLQNDVQTYINLGLEKTKAFFDKLLKPVNSFVDDKKRKIENKFEELQDKLVEKKQLINYSLAIGYAGLAVKDLGLLISNINQGSYRYNDNQKYLDNGFNNYLKINRYIQKASKYESITPQQFKNEIQSLVVESTTQSSTVAFSLTTEEQAQKNKFAKISTYLRELDSVIAILINLKDTVKVDGKLIIEQLKAEVISNSAIKYVNQIVIDFLELLKNFQSPLQIINFINSVDANQLKSSGSVTYLIALEETFFSKIKKILKEQGVVKDIPDSVVMYLFTKIQTLYNNILNTVDVFIKDKIEELKATINRKIEKIQDRVKKSAAKRLKSAVDFEGKALTAALYSSLIAFWAGSVWTNPAGDVVTVTSPGSLPPPLNIPSADGTTNYIDQISNALEFHLKTISGIYIQQTPQGPVTIPWIGYN
jgi:hypothetical protein